MSLVAAVLALSAISADADRLYTVQTELISGTSTLMSIDTATLVMTPIGPLGVPFFFGDLAWDTATSTLYMIDGDGGANALYTVNTSTGAATLVGTHGLDNLYALAFDSATNAMYAAQYFSVPPHALGFNLPLESINLVTGAATSIGSGLGIDVSIGAMAFDSLTNQLFGLDACYPACARMFLIDPALGVDVLVQSGLESDNNGMTFDPVLNRLWNIDTQGRLSFFDPAAGFAQTEVTTYTSLDALQIFDGLAYVTPEPATWVLLLAGFAALGARARRRRR